MPTTSSRMAFSIGTFTRSSTRATSKIDFIMWFLHSMGWAIGRFHYRPIPVHPLHPRDMPHCTMSRLIARDILDFAAYRSQRSPSGNLLMEYASMLLETTLLYIHRSSADCLNTRLRSIVVPSLKPLAHWPIIVLHAYVVRPHRFQPCLY